MSFFEKEEKLSMHAKTTRPVIGPVQHASHHTTDNTKETCNVLDIFTDRRPGFRLYETGRVLRFGCSAFRRTATSVVHNLWSCDRNSVAQDFPEK
jgi:hypothetical protein